MGNTKRGGFTLIEMMITVAIVAILGAIAYPSYMQHVRTSRRADAEGALLGLANAMERFYTSNNTYAGTFDADKKPTIFKTTAPVDGKTAYYNLTIPSADSASYTLRATPITGTTQATNGYLELTSTGERRWDADNNNSISTSEKKW